MQPRPIRDIFWGGLYLLLLTAALQIAGDLLQAFRALPVGVQIVGLPIASLRDTVVSRVAPFGRETELFSWVQAGPEQIEFQLTGQWVKTIRLRLPRKTLDAIRLVGLGIGPESFWFTREQLDPLRKPAGPGEQGREFIVLDLFPPRGPGSGPSLRSWLLNWPGSGSLLDDLAIVGRSLAWPLEFTIFVLALVLGVRSLSHRRRWHDLLETALAAEDAGPSPAPASPSGQVRWCLIGLAVVLLILAGCHWWDRFFFTRHDNREEFLPNVLFGCREVAAGRVPTWNPRELMGAPMLDPGKYFLTYPPTYVSYALARGALSEECLTLEVWAWLHLVLGYLATYAFARAVRLRPSLAATTALTFVFSGFILCTGRDWAPVTALTLWLPLWLWPLALLQERAPGWRWALCQAGAIGLSFYSGNAQFWAYCAVLFAAGVLILAVSGVLGRERALWCAVALTLGLAIASPLLLPELAWTSRLTRLGGAGGGLLDFYPHLFLPTSITDVLCPDSMTGTPSRNGDQFYSGMLLPAAGLAAAISLLGAAGAFADGRRLLGRNLWASCSLFALLMAMGSRGFLWAPLSGVPGFSMLTYPVKFMPYVTFCLAVAGGIALERWLGRRPRGATIETALFAATAALVAYQASLGFVDERRFPLPYPQLKGVIESDGSSGAVGTNRRFVPLAQSWAGQPDNLWSLSFSLPTYYGPLSLDGYNPLVWSSPENLRALRRLQRDPIETFKAYGVRWALQRRTYEPPSATADPTNPGDMHCSMLDSPGLLDAVQAAGRELFKNELVKVWELPGAQPLAFPAADPSRELPCSLGSEGALVDTSSLVDAATVVVNVLARPRLFARGDGQPLAIASDAWDRVTVRVPRGTKRLEVFYRASWETGFGGAAVLLLFAAGLGWLARRASRHGGTGLPASCAVISRR